MSDERREILARQQRELIDALAGGDLPDGFDPRQVRTASRSLAIKRMRTAEKSWPALAAAVGERFDALFERYAAEHPTHEDDARRFLQFLLGAADDPELKLRLCGIRASYGIPACFTLNTAGAALAVRFWGRGVRTWIFRRRPARTTDEVLSRRRG